MTGSDTTTAPDTTAVPEIMTAICAIMAQVRAIAKTDHNDRQNFDFRGIDAVLNECGPALREHCVITIPKVVKIERELTESNRGNALMNTLLTVQYTFKSAVDGSEITVEVVGEAMDSGDKSSTKAMSVAFRTAMIQLFAIPTGERDPDHEVYERGTPAPPQRGTVARHAPTADQADPWAASNPERTRHYAELITHATTDDALRLIWDDIVTDSDKGDLAGVDRSQLSLKIKTRRAEIGAATVRAAMRNSTN